ncbi:uncharacterized protein LOC117107689 [Anneissia japonica]|uniref:uncharacterized protein LOC117107689 n=1 Tax=Anneissia japonica TaxID=1529436 RepID=UPI0014258957|nr:uncharacterized protein LOC117107689 [Anneissia japonica]
MTSKFTEYMANDADFNFIDASNLVPSNKPNHVFRAIVNRRSRALISHVCDVDINDYDSLCSFNVLIGGMNKNVSIIRVIDPPIHDVHISSIKNAIIGEIVNLTVENQPGMYFLNYEWNLDNGDTIQTKMSGITYSWSYNGLYNVSLLTYNNDSQRRDNVLIRIVEKIENLSLIEEASTWNIVEDGKLVVDINHAALVQWSSDGRLQTFCST